LHSSPENFLTATRLGLIVFKGIVWRDLYIHMFFDTMR
jgi:hypothetical protein